MQFFRRKPIRISQADLICYPKLRKISIFSDMNMAWFKRITFVRKEEKRKAFFTENSRHTYSIQHIMKNR